MITRLRHISVVGLCVLAALLGGCNTQNVRSSPTYEPTVAQAPIPEHLLLDAGIDIFDPGIDTLDEGRSTTTPSVRRAEGVHAAYIVAKTLQATRNWGAVRVIPKGQSETDVYVTGKVLKSNGEVLQLSVAVADSSGERWYTRTYTETLSQYAYDTGVRQGREPFQRLYDDIARDMENYARRLEASRIEELRAISKLRFAQRFAPDDYNDFMHRENNGRYTLKRLPADGDPVIQHVEAIRIRDQMFVDRLQDYYGTFNERMSVPYDQWREASYRETKAVRKIKSEATAKKIIGGLATILGVLAQGSSNSSVRTAGVIGIGGGIYSIKSGIERGSEAAIHEAAMHEMADSLGAEVEPLTIELANKTVTLSGTVDEQYAQWREILRQIYFEETGQNDSQTLPAPAQ